MTQPSETLRYWRVRRRDAPDYWIVFQHDPVDAKADPEREVEDLFTASQLAAEVELAVAAERAERTRLLALQQAAHHKEVYERCKRAAAAERSAMRDQLRQEIAHSKEQAKGRDNPRYDYYADAFTMLLVDLEDDDDATGT